MRLIAKTLLLTAYLIPALFYSQSSGKFSKYKSHYINGDAILIGNNIVSKHSSKPFNDFETLNDEIKMVYVDVDRDNTTFNSSSASLIAPISEANIVEATLFWTAVYPFEKGVRKDNGQEIYYEGNNKRSPDIGKVKFKIPGKEYVEISGNVVFDGYEKEGFEDSAPYTYYADVTSLLNENKVLNGEYTVANIHATQGFVSGGSSAGWMLYVVYESEQMRSRYISSYHGFSYLTDAYEDLIFSDFKSVDQGAVDASIFVAALEGDAKLARDEVVVFNPKDSTYVPLRNGQRSPKNFFNGKITIKNKINQKRNPNSQNTLGFDLVEIAAPKSLFQNDQTETVVRIGTKADRFYLFFTAFKIEINELFHLNKASVKVDEPEMETTVVEIDDTGSNSEDSMNTDSAAETVEHTEPREEEKPATEEEITKPEPAQEATITLRPEEMERKMRMRRIRISGEKPGYYLITNVFSKPHYAKKWSDYLLAEGYQPKTLINPKNNWHYVYVYVNPELQTTYNSYLKLVKVDYFKEIWVFKVNL